MYTLVKLYWPFIISFLMILKLLSITTADKEATANTKTISNEPFLKDHLKVGTSKPLGKNLTFINNSYTLNKTSIHDAFIRLESTSLFLSNTVVIGSNILAGGKMDYSVLIENSVFENSEITMDSASNVTIACSRFMMKDIGMEEEPNHVVRIYNTGILFVTDTLFGNESLPNNQNNTSHSEMKHSTDLGMKLENVQNAELRGCTFTGIRAEKSNGSVMLLKNTEMLMVSCQVYLNTANNGVIFGKNSVNITSRNSSFLSNHASKSGAVFYLINSCSLTNDDSVFKNNSARKHAGVVFAMHEVMINNSGCLFLHNFAELGGGSVIWMQYSCQLINKQVLL